MQDLMILFIGKVQVFAYNRAVFPDLFGFGFFFRQVKQPEDLITCSHSIHRNMKKRTQHPHRQKEVRRKQNDQQAAGHGNISCPILRDR